MVGKSHVAFGAITGAALSAFVISKTGSMEMQFINIPLVLIGSLLPDIDNPESSIGIKFPITSRILNKAFGHRFFIHSLFFLALIYLTMYYFTKPFAIIIGAFLAIFIFKSLRMSLVPKILFGPIIAFAITAILVSNSFLLITGLFFGFLGHTFLDLFTADGSGILFPILPKISLCDVASGDPKKFNFRELMFCISVGIICASLIFLFKDSKGAEFLCNYLTQ